MTARMRLSRTQILAFRRRVGALDARLAAGPASLRRAAWAGLQDSMPRAALLSIHARVAGTNADALDNPSLVQIWGPRFSVYVVAEQDLGVFTLGRLATSGKRRDLADDLAARLRTLLGDGSMPFGEAGRMLGEPHNQLRYAAPTGTILLHWDGARQPTIRSVPPPAVAPEEARLELARRYVHVYGPSTHTAFAGWAGVAARSGAKTFDELAPELVPVTTPLGEAWILQSDERTFALDPPEPAPARLLPSGDSYYLLHGDHRTLLVRDETQRNALWTSRVWPGAILVEGEIVGTWRRSKGKVILEPWRRLSRKARDAIEAEATSFPLPGTDEGIDVRWQVP